ncbi:phosphoribosylaminoimidazole synthetase [Pseudomonas aeruginosa]|nr:phosphoribosylaminoimidazole synthetase [Pseudomonas aeruginosa]
MLAAHKSRPIGVIRRSAGRPGVQRCLPVLKARDFIRLATQRPSRLPLDGLLFKI